MSAPSEPAGFPDPQPAWSPAPPQQQWVPVSPGRQPPYGGPRAVPGRRWKRKHTLGCLGSLIALVILVAAIQILITPWAFHIGSKFTPGMSWTGVAVGHSPAGQPFAARLTIQANTLDRHSCSQAGCDDFHGRMDVCTAAGRYSFTNVSGTVGGWRSTDGQTMKFRVAHGTTPATRYLQMDFTGTWHGRVYQSSDEGNLVYGFLPTGGPRTEVTSANPADAVALAFQPGDFDKACASVRSAAH
jgi:hypothetical protein